MQMLNARYALDFNAAHGFSGHLFERRFHTVVLDSDWHLMELARYLALNPVRAGLCGRPEDWEWSSYRAMLGLAPAERFLDPAFLLSQFGRERDRARRAFASFVEAAPRAA
jgi:putative transposase